MPCVSTLSLTLVALAFVISLSAVPAGAASTANIKTLFRNPTTEYSSGPLWVWNDRITDEQVRSTLRDLAGQNIKQVWLHPRPGLMTPYLSDEWFRLWELALAEGKKLGMHVWIYDENSYPSGFAGGFVPEAMPESRGLGLALREMPKPETWPVDLLAVFALDDDDYRDVTGAWHDGESMPVGRYLVATAQPAHREPWTAGRFYVDLMRPGVTEQFLEITLEPYRKHFGEEFGRAIPGVFTDEPNVNPLRGHQCFPWTPGLPEAFRQRWGYDLMTHLPSLNLPVGDYQQVRHDFFHVVQDLFAKHWGEPYQDYCEKHNLLLTGHYWEHDWPIALLVPDNMEMYSFHHVPAIDTLLNQYTEDTHANFGNVRAVRELASVANQLGRSRTLCEAYGAAGWDCRFEDMKRIGDWLYVLGVNTLNQHLSDVSLRGARKRDHPPSFSYHTPWWEAYHEQADYFARLSVALSQGRQINSVLVIEPTTTAWMYQTDESNDPALAALGQSFFRLLMMLETRPVGYDLGSERLIRKLGGVNDDGFKVGQCTYRTVVIAPDTQTLDTPTVDLLTRFIEQEGRVFCCGEPPARVDGRPSDRLAQLAEKDAWQQISPRSLVARLYRDHANGLRIEREPNDGGKLFHHRRTLDDGELLFLVNTSIDHNTRGEVTAEAGSVEQWHPATGTIEPYAYDIAGNQQIRVAYDLPPCGSLLLHLSPQAKDPPSVTPMTHHAIAPQGPLRINRVGPNVLTLDYVDLTVGGNTKKGLSTYQAGDVVYQEHGLQRNPWNCAVQFKDELITRTFPPDSGFEAKYLFHLRDGVPADLAIVIERPDLYTITCNGKPVEWDGRSWWLDKSFGRIDLAGVAIQGDNVLSLMASPMTMMHEVEAAYLLGSFRLEPIGRGFAVVDDAPVVLGPWDQQGHPFYAEGVRYEQTFDLATTTGRYLVSLPDWYGSVAKVEVNGTGAGYIHHAPWQCDVTEHLQTGSNRVAITVIGTLKNTLGPHHGNVPLGLAGPASFGGGPIPGPAPGQAYDVVGYGLFQPFSMTQQVAK